MSKPKLPPDFRVHRCAVCWQTLSTHRYWYEHARARHDADLDPFGFQVCRENCPAIRPFRVKQGTPPRRTRPEPKTVRGRDGNLYTPQRLPDL